MTETEKQMHDLFGRLGGPKRREEALHNCRMCGLTIVSDENAGTDEVTAANGDLVLRILRKDPEHFIFMYNQAYWSMGPERQS